MAIDICIILVLCVCSAFGFKKGFLKSLCSVVIVAISVYLVFLCLPLVLNLFQPVIDKININIPFVDKIIDGLLNNSNNTINIAKMLLRLDELTRITAKTFVFNLLCFVVMYLICKKIIKKTIYKMCDNLKSLCYVGRPDCFLGTAIGLIYGMVFCSAICFIIISINNIGVVGSVLNNQIVSSVLIDYFGGSFVSLLNTVQNMLNIKIYDDAMKLLC